MCGETYRPTESVHRRARSEVVTIQTTAGKECISKRRAREMLPSGLEREARLKSYSEVKRRKGMFDEVLEAICHGASGSGVGRMLGVSASTVCEGWKARSKELLDNSLDGIFPGKERCVIGGSGHRHRGQQTPTGFRGGQQTERGGGEGLVREIACPWIEGGDGAQTSFGS